MIINQTKALSFLARVDPTIVATTPNEMFTKLLDASCNDELDPGLTGDIHEFIFYDDSQKFQFSDLTYCIVQYAGEPLQLVVSYIHDTSFDQHMDVENEPSYLVNIGEQMYEIDASVTEAQVHTDIQALGGKRDDSMIAFYV